MKSALVIGATRGIGRQIALTFAKNGYQVGVAAKTTESTPELPNSIYTVTDEIIAAGGKAAPFVCNVRDEKQLQKTLSDCRDQFGGLDVAIYNAGAIAWQQVIETPVKRFDLMHEVNLRGSYAMVQDVLPYFLERGSGRMILVCPPIYNRFFRGKVTYSLSKVGMTVLVHGLGYELKDTGVTISGIWPSKAIESHVTVKMGTPKRLMRKPTIFADACLKIAQETNPELINGRVLIDEDFLREKGVTDFAEYRSDPDIEPPRMLPEKFPSLLVEEEDAPPLSKL